MEQRLPRSRSGSRRVKWSKQRHLHTRTVDLEFCGPLGSGPTDVTVVLHSPREDLVLHGRQVSSVGKSDRLILIHGDERLVLGDENQLLRTEERPVDRTTRCRSDAFEHWSAAAAALAALAAAGEAEASPAPVENWDRG